MTFVTIRAIHYLSFFTRDRLHRESMDFLSLSTALYSCQNILSEMTFLQGQEVLLSPKDKLSRVVTNYPVIEV